MDEAGDGGTQRPLPRIALGGDTAAGERRRPVAPLTRRGLLLTGLGALVASCLRPDPVTFEPTPEGITPPHGLHYTVNRGDTLSSIARRSGVSVRSIIDANRLDSTVIYPGQDLWLPGAMDISPDPLATPTPNRLGNGYRVFTRRRWTDIPIGANHRRMGSVTRITVHHTSEHPGLEGLSDLEVIQRVDHYHREVLGWAAIGYHYVIGHDGSIYQGRPEKVQGAHVGRANSNNLGVSVMGDFRRKLPNAAQRRSLHAFLEDRRRALGVSKRRIYGHRDLAPSVCPGDSLYAWLRRYKGS